MLKYLREILISAFVGIILCVVTIFFTSNVIAGVSVLTAAIVIINFTLNRYETRNEASVELKIIESGKTHSFLVSIVNTGGKTIYLDKGGMKTKGGIIIDFDEEVNVKLQKKSKPKTSNFGFPSLMDGVEYNLELPKIKPLGSDIVKPGNAQGTRKEVWEVIYLLLDKKAPACEILELKGFFTDQLNQEYESEWMIFTIASLLETAKKDMENQTA
jgi:hypothetical protein